MNQNIPTLNAASLMEQACETAQLSDWGSRDFQVPLAKLIECFRNRYPSNNAMSLYFENAIKALLVNRLYIQDNLKTYTEILQIPLYRPLFIVGLARTGSTLLQRLMAQEPLCRVLSYWEMNYPFIGPKVGLNHEELSIQLSELKVKEIYSRFPELYHIHEIDARKPEECNVLLRHTFCSMAIASEWYLPEYAEWMLEQDLTDSYLYYRNLLQLLCWYKPGDCLVLKCPSHLPRLDTIRKVFPDANILWLHRDPCKAIPSYLALLSVFWGEQTGDTRFIDFILRYSLSSIEKGMTARETIPPAHFLNVSYRELRKNPGEGIANILTYFDYDIDPQIENRIQKWVTENPQHKHGVHRYSLEKFGLNKAGIKKRFSQYYDEYGHFLV